MVIRPPLTRQLVFWMALVLLGFSIALGFHGDWIPAAVLIVGDVAILGTLVALSRVTITADTVRAFPANRGSRSVMPREEMNHVRALRGTTAFYDHNRIAVIKVGITFTVEQLVAIGEELRVPVWDHRTWHGLRELKNGVRLNTIPAPTRPVYPAREESP